MAKRVLPDFPFTPVFPWSHGQRTPQHLDLYPKVAAHIDKLVPLDWMMHRVGEAAQRISDGMDWLDAERPGSDAFYGWSGGKDSLALACVIAATDHDMPSMHCRAPKLMLPRDLEWLDANAPANCAVYDVPIDLDWLAEPEHERDFLFPFQDYGWMIFHLEAQERHRKDGGFGMMIFGRRTQDRNMIRRNSDGLPLFVRKDGTGILNPLADWIVEEVMACIHYFHEGGTANMPAHYHRGGARGGWASGFSAWPANLRPPWQTKADLFAYVAKDDRSVVEEAAEHFEAAREALDRDEQ